MNWAAISKKRFKLAVRLVAAVFAYSLLRNAGFYGFTAPEAEGLGTMLLLVGSIYAVIYAFAIFVIWGQFNDVAQGSEWEALGNRRRDQETEKSFAGLVNIVIRTAPANPAEEILHQGLVELARKAGEYRDVRISK